MVAIETLLSKDVAMCLNVHLYHVYFCLFFFVQKYKDFKYLRRCDRTQLVLWCHLVYSDRWLLLGGVLMCCDTHLIPLWSSFIFILYDYIFVEVCFYLDNWLGVSWETFRLMTIYQCDFYFKKRINLFSKDALHWSKVTVRKHFYCYQRFLFEINTIHKTILIFFLTSFSQILFSILIIIRIEML